MMWIRNALFLCAVVLETNSLPAVKENEGESESLSRSGSSLSTNAESTEGPIIIKRKKRSENPEIDADLEIDNQSNDNSVSGIDNHSTDPGNVESSLSIFDTEPLKKACYLADYWVNISEILPHFRTDMFGLINIGQCLGHCDTIFGYHNNNGYLKKLNGIKTTCVPDIYAPSNIMIITNGTVDIVTFEDIVVASCSCR